MTKIILHHSRALGLPNGMVLRPEVATDIKDWHIIKDHNIIKAWLKANVLEVADEDGDPDNSAAGASSTDGGGTPGDGALAPGADSGAGKEPAEEDLEALKERAKELGIKFTWNTKPETLKEKIAEAEGEGAGNS